MIYLALADAQKVQFEQDKRAINAATAANLQRLDRAGYTGEQATRLLPLLSAGTSSINAVLVASARPTITNPTRPRIIGHTGSMSSKSIIMPIETKKTLLKRSRMPAKERSTAVR